MNSLLRRFVSNRLAVGAACLTVLLVGTVSVVSAVDIGTGHAYEGQWHWYAGDSDSCSYTHDADTWSASNPGEVVAKDVNAHNEFCKMPKPAGGCNTTSTSHPGATCGAINGMPQNQDHIYERTRTATPLPSPSVGVAD